MSQTTARALPPVCLRVTPRGAGELRSVRRAGASSRRTRGHCRFAFSQSCRARLSRYDDVDEITPMMLATSAVGAIGSACSVFALVATIETTCSTAVVAASGLVEAEEIMGMEYSSRVMAARAARTAPPVDLDADRARTGQEMFDCEIQSVRCLA